MSACAVCGGDGATRQVTHGGTYYGSACQHPECLGLCWEAHFVRETAAGPYEMDLVLWRWQRRRAEREGRTFLLPPPASPAEREAMQALERAGLTF